jgi:hypothetical protein
MKENTFGFGYDPTDAKHHFLVEIPLYTENIKIWERFDWNSSMEDEILIAKKIPEQILDQRFDKLKCEIKNSWWKDIENTLKNEFNLRLKQWEVKPSSWSVGQNIVHRLLGKEMTLLCWAIEECEKNKIEWAIKNWLGLKPEERWWLFTMTNASTGEAKNITGWRKAVRFALTENPVTTTRHQSLFDNLVKEPETPYKSKNK